MKYLLFLVGLLFLIPLIHAENCSYQNEINADCNIVVMPLDSNFNRCTSSCKCNLNLYNPSYTILINNVPMAWNNIMKTFYMRTDTNLSVSGIFSVDVNCNALDTNRNIAGQFLVVDRDSNHLLHDINSAQITTTQIWNNATRTLTDYNQSTLWNDLRDMNRDINNMPLSIWNYATRNLTDYNMLSLPAYIWGYGTKTLTDYNMTNFPVYLWNYVTRTLTDYNQSLMFQYLSDINNSQFTPAQIWNNSTKTLTDYNMLTLPAYLWNYGTKTLTDYNQNMIFAYLSDINNSSGITPAQVWNYGTRTLTDYNFVSLPSYIWNYGTKVLTDYNQVLVFQYLSDINNSSGGGTGLTASQVWSYGSRALTDYNQSLVWSYLSDLNSTCSSGGGGGSLTASQVWGYGNRTLTGNTTEIQRLYNNVVMQNTARYCAVGDVACEKEQASVTPIDVNAISYKKQVDSTLFLGIEWNPQNIIIGVIIIIVFVGAVYWISKW